MHRLVARRFVAASCCLLLLLGGVVLPLPASGRDNILIGDLSISYDYTKRKYSDVNVAVAGAEEDGQVPAIIPAYGSHTGDRRDYTVSPSLTFSSQGQTDLLAITYAPGFVYDELRYTTRVDHSFSLRAEKHVTRRWFLSLDNTYFLGNDPARETSLRTSEAPTAETGPQGEEAQTPEQQVQEQQQVEDTGALDERVGSRRYWRNTTGILGEYSYGRDSLVGAGYTYEILRNSGDEVGGYTEYDRHRFMAHLAHRFNAKWQLDFEGNYSKGIFDEPAVVAVTPAAEEDGAVDVLQPQTAGSSDLAEYIGSIRVNYSWLNHATIFFSDNSSRTDYDDPLRQDNWAHNLAVGLEYYFNERLYATLSGGPSFSKLGEQAWETDYNIYGSLTRLYLHASLTAHISKSYDVQNFAGRGNGLTDTWEAGVDYSYDFSPNLATVLFVSYRDDRRLQHPYVDTLVVLPEEAVAAEEPLPAELVEDFDYHEKLFQAGFSLNYTFLRWYTLSGGYTYARDETGLAGSADYDEHRVFVQLAVSRNLFRW